MEEQGELIHKGPTDPVTGRPLGWDCEWKDLPHADHLRHHWDWIDEMAAESPDAVQYLRAPCKGWPVATWDRAVKRAKELAEELRRESGD